MKGILDELADSVAEVQQTALERLPRDLSSYTKVSELSLKRSTARNLAVAVRVLQTDRMPGSRDLSEAESTTRERAADGVPLEDMQRAYRVSVTVIEDTFITIATRASLPPELILKAARLLWSASDVFATRAALVYRDLDVARAVSDVQVRDQFLWQLLNGDLSERELSGRASAHGLSLEDQYFALRARATDHNGQEPLRRSLQDDGRPDLGGSLVGIRGDECVGIVSAVPIARQRNVVIALGPATSLSNISESFETASLVQVAVRDGSISGVVSLSDVTWRIAVAKFPVVTAILREKYLSPLREKGEFRDVLIESVRQYLQADRNIAKAAALQSIHVNTLRYRLRQFEDLADVDLESTSVLVELTWLLDSLST